MRFSGGSKARAVIFSDGTPWFVAKDVCEGLQIKFNPSIAVKRLAEDQRRTVWKREVCDFSVMDQLYPGTTSAVVLISRGGFNDLVLESRKPVAREYRQWVTDEVLAPSGHHNMWNKAPSDHQMLTVRWRTRRIALMRRVPLRLVSARIA